MGHRLLLTIILLISLSSLNLSCCQRQVKDGGGKKAINKDRCGYCLAEQKRPVCTKKGTMYNSCLAICRGRGGTDPDFEIQCEGPCPCPKR